MPLSCVLPVELQHLCSKTLIFNQSICAAHEMGTGTGKGSSAGNKIAWWQGDGSWRGRAGSLYISSWEAIRDYQSHVVVVYEVG